MKDSSQISDRQSLINFSLDKVQNCDENNFSSLNSLNQFKTPFKQFIASDSATASIFSCNFSSPNVTEGSSDAISAEAPLIIGELVDSVDSIFSDESGADEADEASVELKRYRIRRRGKKRRSSKQSIVSTSIQQLSICTTSALSPLSPPFVPSTDTMHICFNSPPPPVACTKLHVSDKMQPSASPFQWERGSLNNGAFSPSVLLLRAKKNLVEDNYLSSPLISTMSGKSVGDSVTSLVGSGFKKEFTPFYPTNNSSFMLNNSRMMSNYTGMSVCNYPRNLFYTHFNSSDDQEEPMLPPGLI